MPELWGVEIKGVVYRQDNEPLDHDELLNAVITMAEENGWFFAGTTTPIDLNKAEAE